MRIRPDRYYIILCERKSSKESLEIDDTTADELVRLVCEALPERLTSTKDENGKFKKNVPYTKVKIVCFDKNLKQNWSVTHGNIYNLSPTQVKERILKAIKTNN